MKIPKDSGTKIDAILKQVLRLKGGSQDLEDFAYEPSLCARCGEAVRADGQEVLGCLATAEGIYFRCKVKCVCGNSLGFVRVVEDKEND